MRAYVFVQCSMFIDTHAHSVFPHEVSQLPISGVCAFIDVIISCITEKPYTNKLPNSHTHTQSVQYSLEYSMTGNVLWIVLKFLHCAWKLLIIILKWVDISRMIDDCVSYTVVTAALCLCARICRNYVSGCASHSTRICYTLIILKIIQMFF